jgi:predicted secreted hydrolase
MNVSPNVLWTLLRKPNWLEALLHTSARWEHELSNQSAANRCPTRQDDGAHPDGSPFYFEWWYFDVSLPNGAALAFIFHLTDLINPAARTGSVNVSLFRPGQPTWTHFAPYPRGEIIASSVECDLRIGSNRCWAAADDTYHILIDEPQVSAELTFHSMIPGWRPGDGTIEFGNPQRFFSWVVPQPRAKVSGYIELPNSRFNIEGIGYHDHNWGTASLIETLNAWTWGRVYMDDYTLVYADMLMSPRYQSARPTPFLLAYKDQCLVSSFLSKDVALDAKHDFLFAPDHVQRPAGWNLAWQQSDEWFNITLRTKHILERADLLRDQHPLTRSVIRGLVAHPYYVRCVTDVEGDFALQGRTVRVSTGRAICEQMVLRTPQRPPRRSSVPPS